MPAAGPILMTRKEIVKNGCILPGTSKCRWLKEYATMDAHDTTKTVHVFGCVSEEETCGGCCRRMEEIERGELE